MLVPVNVTQIRGTLKMLLLLLLLFFIFLFFKIFIKALDHYQFVENWCRQYPAVASLKSSAIFSVFYPDCVVDIVLTFGHHNYLW